MSITIYFTPQVKEIYLPHSNKQNYTKFPDFFYFDRQFPLKFNKLIFGFKYLVLPIIHFLTTCYESLTISHIMLEYNYQIISGPSEI
jgi:hypothetical protein